MRAQTPRVAAARGPDVKGESGGAQVTQFAGQQLSQLAEKLSGGSLTPLLVHLVENNRLSRRELDELRALLASRKKPN